MCVVRLTDRPYNVEDVVTTDVRQKDFSKVRKPIQFTVGANTYHARTTIAPKKLMVAKDMLSDSSLNALERVAKAFKLLLKPESYELIRPQFDPTPEEEEEDRDYGDEAVDVEQMMAIIIWMMEAYTGRPLTQSSDSVTGSETAGPGTTSPDGASAAE
jgi:hypothetical protein